MSKKKYGKAFGWTRKRELELVELLSKGYSFQLIADFLKLTHGSISQKVIRTGFINLTDEECRKYNVLKWEPPVKIENDDPRRLEMLRRYPNE